MVPGATAPTARRVYPGESGRRFVEWEFPTVPPRHWVDLLAGAGLPVKLRWRLDGRRLRVAALIRDLPAIIEAVEKAMVVATERYRWEPRADENQKPALAGEALYEEDLADLLKGQVGRRVGRST